MQHKGRATVVQYDPKCFSPKSFFNIADITKIKTWLTEESFSLHVHVNLQFKLQL